MSDQMKSKYNVEMLGELVLKGWGSETIFANNELYCGKILAFDKAGNKSSMHFHIDKDESWHVLYGAFTLRIMDMTTASIDEFTLEMGESIRIYPMMVHQLEALEDNSLILEVSTRDKPSDNYRVAPGDSQKAP